MDNRKEIIQQCVNKLQGVHNLDEFIKNEEEIIRLLDSYIQSAIDGLKEYLDNMKSMAPEEREEKAQMFQDESFPFEPLVEKEMQRLDTLPGFIDYADEFGPKMDKVMEPHMKRYGEYMEKVMENLMGGVSQVMEGMMEGMAQAFENEEMTQEEETIEFDDENPETPVMLYDLYYSRTLEALKENKESLIESCNEQLQDDIWYLEVLADMPSEEYFDSDKEKIAKIQKHMQRLEPEMEKEFARISALPNAAEESAKIKMEIMQHLETKVKEVNAYLNQIKHLETH